MKVLMFGWEFPPHISGGLGTACYGLTKGLTRIPDVDVTFIVPKAFGDEDQTAMRLIGANMVAISKKDFQFAETENTIEYLEVDSEIIPYVGEQQFWKLKSEKYPGRVKFVETDGNAKIHFSGAYGPGLIQEIKNYALVARVIALENDFDVIHAHDWLAYPGRNCC